MDSNTLARATADCLLDALADRVAARIADRLGTGVDTLMRTAAGLPIRVATLAMIRGRLGRLGGCR